MEWTSLDIIGYHWTMDMSDMSDMFQCRMFIMDSSLAPVSAKLPRLNRCYDVLAESVVGTNLAPNATSAKDTDTSAHKRSHPFKIESEVSFETT